MNASLTAQDRVLLILRGAERYAHSSGREMQALSKRRLQSAGDLHLAVIMQTWGQDEVCRIVATWMQTYQLPLNSQKLKNFELFHTQYGDYINNPHNRERMQAYA